MNFRDQRPVREQVISGLRIGGSMVLAFTYFIALALGTMMLLRRGDYSGPASYQIGGALLLTTLSLVMVFTTRYWAKWVVGIVAYVLAKTLFGAPIFLLLASLGGNWRTATDFAVTLILSAIAILLTWRYHERDPAGAERLGMVVFVLSLAFGLGLESYVPILAGMAFLGLTEVPGFLRRRRRKIIRNKVPAPLDGSPTTPNLNNRP